MLQLEMFMIVAGIVCVCAGEVILISRSLCPGWDLGRTMPSLRAITCRSKPAFAMQL